MGKIILYIATSEDGFIADKYGGVDWLPQPSDEADDMGYKGLLGHIKFIFMGSKSYQQILGFGKWAWRDKTTYVFTSNKSHVNKETIHFVDDDLSGFMKSFKFAHPNDNVWLLGGAELVKSFAKLKLIDECIITIIPTFLKEGIKLEIPYNDFMLKETKNSGEGIRQQVFLKKF